MRKLKKPSNLHKKLRRRSKQVKDMVPDSVAEKAGQLNPLAMPEAPALTENVEPITNETIAEHREEVLKGARKYIYPLQHSKRKILLIRSGIIVAAIIAFLVYCSYGLYRAYQYNTFLYRVTQVVPFPIAKADGHFISYENYLFELRHYVHYYQNQLGRDFAGDDKQQLIAFRKQALQDAINNAYVKILASQNAVSVSNNEVNARMNEVRNQNRLGSNDKVFSDVLRDYWGWSVNDFKRSLKEEMLSEKVAAKLDVAAMAKANSALAQLQSGADFSKLAQKVSEDPGAQNNGGAYDGPINDSNPNVPPQVVNALFSLQPGQTSGVIIAGNTLEIVKLQSKKGNTVTASHISFNVQPISNFIAPLEKAHPPHDYVHF